MAKPNYQQVRRQRELAKKSRQQEKLQRKAARAAAAASGSEVPGQASAPADAFASSPERNE